VARSDAPRERLCQDPGAIRIGSKQNT